MSEKEGALLSHPSAPPVYSQAVGQPGYQGYGPATGVPSYAASGQPGYNTNYGTSPQVVVRQPAGYAYPPGGVNPAPDHMMLAILATVLCCWPIGIIAILKAQDARRALDRGDVPTAIMYSNQAKRYSLIAIGFGVALVVVVIVVVAVVLTTATYY